MTPLQFITYICVGLVVAVMTIAWLYTAARMISYGWKRGHWRAEQDNKQEQQENHPEQQ